MNKASERMATLPDEEAFWQLVNASNDAQRLVLLDACCGDDEAKRNRLEDLLRHRVAADRMFGRFEGDSVGDVQASFQPSSKTKREVESLVDTPREIAALGRLKQLGNYQLVRLVGRGGMGNVFFARDQQLQRDVAVKIPRLDLMFLPGLEDRFLREAQAAARLDHPNLVSILQVGTEGPVPYIATHWCDRGDLFTWMRKTHAPPEPTLAAEFMSQVADAIQHCHECGVVHLDLKPSNILLVSQAKCGDRDRTLTQLTPKVTDFGLARLLEHQLDKSSTSMFLGTPLYMAPEQAECKRELIGPATDVFALGVVIHELACGKRPFDGETATTVMDQVRRVEFVDSTSTRHLPRDLRTIISRCLQRDPADRYASAGKLADDLRRFANSQPIHAQPVSVTRRFWLWCSRPERITQAGVVTVAIQLAVLGNLYSHFLLKAIGYQPPMNFESWTFFKETIPVALFPHFPTLINGFRILARRRWSMTIGTILSLVFAFALLSVLMGGQPAFSAYEGNPLATYVAHLFIFCLAMIQLIVNLVAIPAAWGKSNPK